MFTLVHPKRLRMADTRIPKDSLYSELTLGKLKKRSSPATLHWRMQAWHESLWHWYSWLGATSGWQKSLEVHCKQRLSGWWRKTETTNNGKTTQAESQPTTSPQSHFQHSWLHMRLVRLTLQVKDQPRQPQEKVLHRNRRNSIVIDWQMPTHECWYHVFIASCRCMNAGTMVPCFPI